MFSTLSPEAMHNLFESPADKAPAIHIFDLTDVPYMDSSGLAMIIGQYVRCQAKGLRMVAGERARASWNGSDSPNWTPSFPWSPQLSKPKPTP